MAPCVRAAQANRWRKRALSLVPVRWPIYLVGRYPALVSIYRDDGTVSVSTGGVEMGQGLNTKVRWSTNYTPLGAYSKR